ncbi:MAG: hypothetical protein WCF19_01835 [Chlamydiales bacterium]
MTTRTGPRTPLGIEAVAQLQSTDDLIKNGILRKDSALRNDAISKLIGLQERTRKEAVLLATAMINLRGPADAALTQSEYTKVIIALDAGIARAQATGPCGGYGKTIIKAATVLATLAAAGTNYYMKYMMDTPTGKFSAF